MEKECQVAAFVGGSLQLRTQASREREVVLALPTSRLIVRILRVPAGEDCVAFAKPVLKALSPYPDEDPSVSCEKIRATETETVVLAAALPEGSTDDLADALDAARLHVVRVDLLVLGALRQIWNDLDVSDGARRLVRFTSAEGTTQIVLDGDLPCSIRALTDSSQLARETMFSLLEAEDFNGPRELKETIEREIDVSAALEGIAARAVEPDSLNVLPASWLEVLCETRFKARLIKNLLVAGVVWALVMGVLFGVPLTYGFMTDHMLGLCREHAARHAKVLEKKQRTEVVRKYSDHSRGALEVMRAVSESVTEGITLNQWDYVREESLRVRGESEGTTPVYSFKDAAVDLGGDALLFPVVKLGSLTAIKDGKQKFDLECQMTETEVEE